MPREVYRFAVTVPAGTLQAAPQTTPLAMPERVVSRVRARVPPGPHGLVGFQLASGGLQMLPINQGAFVVTDDEKLSWDLDGYITSGAWQCIAYNTGTFPHTIEFIFETDPVPLPAAAASFSLLANSSLAARPRKV